MDRNKNVFGIIVNIFVSMVVTLFILKITGNL